MSEKFKPCLTCGAPIKDTGLNNRGYCDLQCTDLGCGTCWGEWDKEEWNTNWAHSTIDRLTQENERLRAAAKNVLDQFEAMKRHQHKLLVEGQTLESASKNWKEATDIPFIDFTALQEALKETPQK